MFKFVTQNHLDSFIDSLTYWQAINLRITLLTSKHQHMTISEAKLQAVREYSDPDKLKYDLEESLNSPI